MALTLDTLWAQRRRVAMLSIMIWVGAGAYGYALPNFIASLPGQVEKLPRTFVINAVNTLESCAGPNDVAVFALFPSEKEWLNDMVLQYYLHDISIPYAQIAHITNINNIITPEATSTPTKDYVRRVREFVGVSPQVWLFVLDTDVSPELIEQFKGVIPPATTLHIVKDSIGC
jgi:hypothetical protein